MTAPKKQPLEAGWLMQACERLQTYLPRGLMGTGFCVAGSTMAIALFLLTGGPAGALGGDC